MPTEAEDTAAEIREFEKRRRNQIVPILTPRRGANTSSNTTGGTPSSSPRKTAGAAAGGGCAAVVDAAPAPFAYPAIPVGTLQDVRDAMLLMKRAGVSGIQKTSITHREFVIDGVPFRNYPCVPVRLSAPLSFAKTIVELRRNPFTCELRRWMPIDSTLSASALHALGPFTACWAPRCTVDHGIPHRSYGSMGDTPRGFQLFFAELFAGKCVTSTRDATEWYTLVCDGLLEQLPFQFLASKLLLTLCSSVESCRNYTVAFFSIVQHLILSKGRPVTVQDFVALVASCETLAQLNGMTDPSAPVQFRALRDEVASLRELQGTRMELHANEMAEGIARRCPVLHGLLTANHAANVAHIALEELAMCLPKPKPKAGAIAAAPAPLTPTQSASYMVTSITCSGNPWA